MCYKICDFDNEALTYVDAWCNSSTLNELFDILDASDVWNNRRQRLGSRTTMGWWRWEYTNDGRRRRVKLTNIEGNPRHYTTWQMARSLHKALQRKGVLLPAWTSRQYHCTDNRLPLSNRLNARLASA